MVLFSDALTLDAPRRTADGYLAVRAKAARTGTYQYLGSEIDPDNKHGLRDAGMVNVLRDDSAVFDKKSAHSFIGKPVTDDHPSVAVNAGNWRDHARGVVMGAMKDGEYLAFDLLLTDAGAIKAVDGGKRELSNGYAADLAFGDYTGPGGVKCVAKQVAITGNHVAIVDKGRAGPSCAITDSIALCDANPAAVADLTPPLETPAMKIRIGDAEVDATNGEAVRIANDAREAQFKDAVSRASTAETALATAQTAHDKAMAAKDAEIDDLKAKVVDEATIDARAAAKADVVSKARAILGDKAPDFAGKSIADVRRETVRIVKGDTAVNDKSDDYVEARFDGLNDAKTGVQPIGAPRLIADNAAAVSTIRAARYA